MADISIKFLCGLRGYHEYCSVWTPVLNEVLRAKQENSNPHNHYAIAVTKQHGLRQQVIGHLPREISRFTWFIIDHGASVSVKVVDVHQRRSPLVQGGLEIPIEVCIVMKLSDENKKALETYKTLIGENYEEPDADGKFPDFTASVLAGLEMSSESDTDEEDIETMDA